jgi:hypothetical protein
MKKTLQQSFEKRNADVLFKLGGSKIKLDLRNIILLDSQSTMDLFCNPHLIKEVTKTTNVMNLQSNGGTMQIRHKASITGYHHQVWFSKFALTNIIALSNLIKQYRVTYDSRDEIFVVHRLTDNLPNMEFKMHSSGLHYYEPNHKDLTFVNTVDDDKKVFSKRQLKGAELAGTLYATLGYPSVKDFKWVIQSNQIKGCPVTVQDIVTAHQIWGKNIAALKGKTTRHKSRHVATDFVKVPTAILKLHRYVTLAADLFFVNRIPFFLTYSRRICFTGVNHLADRFTKTIFKAYHQIHYFYLKRGFHITTLNVDGEFAPLQVPIQSMPGRPEVNLRSANKHVPEIERRIRVVKERARSFRHSLPFNRIPKLLTIHIVFVAVKLLNHFPPKGGISDTISPKTIMTGETLDYKTHLSLQLGQYCQVHEEDTPRNSQLPQTQGAICLGPSGNIQGGFKFMSMTSSKKIVQRSWDKIPMPQTVIDQVNHLGKDQPEQFIFTDRKGQPIGDVEDLPGADDLDTDADNELAGVDGKIETPQYLEPIPETMNQTDDLNINENNQGIEEDAIPDDNQEVEPAPVEQSPDTQVEDTQVEDIPPTTTAPDVTPGVQRSTRVRMQTRDNDYIPSLSGSSKYAYAVTQLERHSALHPDAQMLFQTDMYQAEPDGDHDSTLTQGRTPRVGKGSTESSPF